MSRGWHGTKLHPAVVRVQIKGRDTGSDFRVIREADFDAAIHTVFEDGVVDYDTTASIEANAVAAAESAEHEARKTAAREVMEEDSAPSDQYPWPLPGQKELDFNDAE